MRKKHLEVVKKRIGNKIKFRTKLRQGKLFVECKQLNFYCMFCRENRAEKQLASRYGRVGNKTACTSWYWICKDCIKELKTIT